MESIDTKQIEPGQFPSMPTACPEPGLYLDVADTDYFRWAAWSQSHLKRFGDWSEKAGAVVPAPGRGMGGKHKSPAHAYAELMDPSPPTDAQKFGTKYHRLLMEPSRFLKHYVVVLHEINGRTNAGKAEWEALVQQYGEGNIIERDEWATLQAMRKAAMDHKVVGPLLGAIGQHEVSVVWIDEETGQRCKVRIDKIVSPSEEYPRWRIIDLKSTRCAHWEKFQWDAEEYGYHIQGSACVDGFAAAMGVDPNLIEFWLVPQEKEPPYAAVANPLPAQWIEAGRVVRRAALKRAAECLKTNYWPAYADERPIPLHLPDRAMAETDAA